MSKYKDNIKFYLGSRIGGRRLNSSGFEQQNVMELLNFLATWKRTTNFSRRTLIQECNKRDQSGESAECTYYP